MSDDILKLIDELYKKRNALNWCYKEPMSTIVHNCSGEEVNQKYLKTILLCFYVDFTKFSKLGVNENANKLTKDLNKEELATYMNEVFDRWIEDGADVKKKWILYAVSIYGGEQIVDKLQQNIINWAKNKRGVIASEAVMALALNDSKMALLIVDSISKKFKYKQVKNTANLALEFASKQMGITKEELEDRIVPDFGFNQNMLRIFDYGNRKFNVYISSTLELEIFDEKNKKLKNLPAPSKKDDEVKAKLAYDEFKQIKKQIKTTIANQKLRLDLALSALSTERKWTKEQWENLFIKNPIMRQFAISLIWGVYEGKDLKDTFRYMEDGSFNKVDEDEYELEDNIIIGLVHPIELSEEQREQWICQLEDYEIEQPIEQLKRPIFEVTEQEVDSVDLFRFSGKILNGASLSGKLLAMNWERGDIMDGGGFFNYFKEDEKLGFGAELYFSGMCVGYENEEVKIYCVRFYEIGVEKDKFFGVIPKDKTLKLSKVPKRFFSEIAYQIQIATASSTRIDTEWKKEVDKFLTF